MDFHPPAFLQYATRSGLRQAAMFLKSPACVSTYHICAARYSGQVALSPSMDSHGLKR